MKNVCPECGGVLNGDRCQFCGAVIIDMASIDLEKPFYLKFIKGAFVYRSKCIVDSIEIDHSIEQPQLYCENGPMVSLRRYRPPTISMNMTVIPSTNGIEFLIVDTLMAEKDDIKDAYNKQRRKNETAGAY